MIRVVRLSDFDRALMRLARWFPCSYVIHEITVGRGAIDLLASIPGRGKRCCYRCRVTLAGVQSVVLEPEVFA